MAKAIESIESPTPKEGVGWGCRRGARPPCTPPERSCVHGYQPHRKKFSRIGTDPTFC